MNTTTNLLSVISPSDLERYKLLVDAASTASPNWWLTSIALACVVGLAWVFVWSRSDNRKLFDRIVKMQDDQAQTLVSVIKENTKAQSEAAAAFSSIANGMREMRSELSSLHEEVIKGKT